VGGPLAEVALVTISIYPITHQDIAQILIFGIVFGAAGGFGLWGT
jgi:hypothetical protein